jgi:RNase P subunit RPR2
MVLTNEQINVFRKWLNDYGVRHDCESCGRKTKWKIGNKLISPFEIGIVGGVAQLPKKQLPLLYIICKDCGHVRFYSSISANVLPDLWQEMTPEELDPDQEEW